MGGTKTFSCGRIQWESAHSEYLADLDDDVAHQEELHFSSADCSSFAVGSQKQVDGHEDGDEGDEDGAEIGEVAAAAERNASKNAAAIGGSWRLIVVHEELLNGG